MLIYLVAGGVFLASLAAVIIIVARKFPQLTMIDVDALPKERDRQKKMELIERRVLRSVSGWWSGVREKASGPLGHVGEAFREAYERALAAERRFATKPSVTPVVIREKINSLMSEAALLAKESRFAEAETRFIEVIRLNSRHVGAYRGLGEAYVELKQWAQAKETMEFLIRTVARSGCAHARAAQARRFDIKEITCNASQAEHAEMARDYLMLGGVCQESGDLRCAQRSFECALVFEPNNPRYLDLFLEACILVGDREKGMVAFGKLKEANPDNQKLTSLQERLEAIQITDRKQSGS